MDIARHDANGHPFHAVGDHDAATLAQMRNVASAEPVAGAALCADGHLGYNMPIGGVVAYRDHVSPAGVGFDIACGNKAVLTDLTFADVASDVPRIMDEVAAGLSFGVGRKNAERVDHPLFDRDTWREVAPLTDEALREKARNQLGTIGSGNHYVDLFRDEQGRVWVGCHFGSRGLGHTVASHFLRAAGANPEGNAMAPPVLLPTGTPLGDDYVAAMAVAGEYAYAGRDWVCDRVLGILGARALDEVHNHHNFAWREEVDGAPAWVVRKGATPAFPGQRGFVGGSMGDVSVILEGVDSPNSARLLRSTVHGAGRVMSRTRAAGKIMRKGPARGTRTGGEITPEMMRKWLDAAGVALRGGGTDEAPQAYRRLPEVLAAHGDTIRVLHTLTPFGVCMAGDRELDPYKD